MSLSLPEAERKTVSGHRRKRAVAGDFPCCKAAENVKAFSMYKKDGFMEYGRNPKGFHSRKTGFQEVIYMRLEL